MKYILSLLSFLCVLCCSAASDLSAPILDLQTSKNQSFGEKIIQLDAKKRPNRNKWEGNNTLILRLVINGVEEEFELIKSNLTSGDYKLHTAGGRAISEGDHLIYQYIQTGETQKSCALSWTSKGISALIFYHNESYRMVSTDLNTFKWINERDFPIANSFTCETEELTNYHHQNHGADILHQNRSNSDRCIDVYFEVDHQLFLNLDSSINNAEEWVLALVNEIQMVYDLEEVTLRISSLKIWDEIDPYADQNSTRNMMDAFADEIQNSYEGRLAHLLSARQVGGGVAWVNKLCGQYSANWSSGPYGVSARLQVDYNDFPNYSWPVNVVSHELGHNLGSKHTHDCEWNGNNTQIDDCGNQITLNPNNCYDADNPILPEDGTVMSYCHVTSPGVNLALGFGDQPGDLIRSRIDNANCVVGSCTTISAACVGDFNENGTIDTGDLLILIGTIGCTSDCLSGDVDEDSDVDTGDLVELVSMLGSDCGL